MYGGLVYQVLKDYEDCERANLCLKGMYESGFILVLLVFRLEEQGWERG